MTDTPARRAGLYMRISRDQTGEALGVGRQEEDCRALAKTLGWDVAEVYIDNDISATSNSDPAIGAPADTEVLYASANGVSGHGWAGLRLCMHHPHVGQGTLPTISQHEMEYVHWALSQPLPSEPVHERRRLT